MEMQDVRNKLKRGNQLLFSRDSPCLQELILLISRQKHRTLVKWALDGARGPVKRLKARYPLSLIHISQATAQDLDVSVGWAAILRLYGLGILLVLAATAIPSALVMRYKPRTILTRAG